jgi:uncharacterized protein YhdP
MKGNFHVDITNGKISKFTMLSKMLSMFSISRILEFRKPDLMSKGMPFDRTEADFVLDNGTITTENLLLKSHAMNLSAVGTIDLTKKQIDLTVGAQLLQTIGKILGNIPIAKEFFTGKNKSMTIAYFKIKGTYKDPDVSPMTIKSLTSPILKFFKTIIDIPRDIILPKKDKNPDNKKDDKRK